MGRVKSLYTHQRQGTVFNAISSIATQLYESKQRIVRLNFESRYFYGMTIEIWRVCKKSNDLQKRECKFLLFYGICGANS